MLACEFRGRGSLGKGREERGTEWLNLINKVSEKSCRDLILPFARLTCALRFMHNTRPWCVCVSGGGVLLGLKKGIIAKEETQKRQF